MNTHKDHYLLIVPATANGEEQDCEVTLAVVRISRDQVKNWREYAGVVSALARAGSGVYKLAAWCAVDFYDKNPVSADHPAYDEVESVIEDEERESWCLVDENAFDTSVESVRSVRNQVDVWSAEVVFCGQSKYGNDRYESAMVDINDLRERLDTTIA